MTSAPPVGVLWQVAWIGRQPVQAALYIARRQSQRIIPPDLGFVNRFGRTVALRLTAIHGATDMGLSLGEAATATGLNKTTILRSIRAGRLSATQDGLGRWCIEPAELHRLYPPASEKHIAGNATSHHAVVVDVLEQQIAVLKETVADVRADRDHWRDQAMTALRQLSGPPSVIPMPAPANGAPAPTSWWTRLTKSAHSA